MDKQSTFNTVVKGLASQGFMRSQTENGYGPCRFRGANGRKCAVGHLASDEQLAKALELETPNAPCPPLSDEASTNFVLDVMGIYDIAEQNFLFELQRAHDIAILPERMKEELSFIAAKFSLIPPPEL